ncbi:MAG: hypothetical protein RSA02_04365 [Bacteroidales bacterium]
MSQIIVADVDDFMGKIRQLIQEEIHKALNPTNRSFKHSEAAHILGVTPKTLHKKIFDGYIRAMADGRISAEEITNYTNSKKPPKGW